MVQTIQNPASSQPEIWLPRIIQVRTTIMMLDTPQIPFALLKEDPIPVVEQYIETYVQSSVTLPDMQKIVIDAWNKPFAALTCDQNFFIYAWSAEQSASLKVARQAMLSVGIATPGPSYKRWFITRPILRQQALVAWCIEIDMGKASNGRMMPEIVLSEENMICLLPK